MGLGGANTRFHGAGNPISTHMETDELNARIEPQWGRCKRKSYDENSTIQLREPGIEAARPVAVAARCPVGGLAVVFRPARPPRPRRPLVRPRPRGRGEERRGFLIYRPHRA